MRIKIDQKYAPFTHVPGSFLMIPKSMYRMQVFPTKLCIEHVDTKKVTELDVLITGPIKNFTVICDLEKGCVRISGTSIEGYFYYAIFAGKKSIDLHVKRSPKEGMTFRIGSKEHHLSSKETHSIIKENSISLTETKERISFGNFKQQDFDKIKSRQDISEIIPLLMFYERYLPQKIKPLDISIPLMDELERFIAAKDRMKLEQAILNIFNVHFDGIFTTVFHDKNHLGLTAAIDSMGINSFIILKRLIDLLKSLFIQVDGNNINILPVLPVSFHAGRYTDINAGDISVGIEWSKKLIKKMEVSSKIAGEYKLHLQRGIKSYRIRKNTKERGIKMRVSNSLMIPNEGILYLDRFEK